jgi:L-seryl-tRNA(Ser) seleniumtransferase
MLDGQERAVRLNAALRSALPSVDELLRDRSLTALVAQYGRTAVRDALRTVLKAYRESGSGPTTKRPPEEWARVCSQELELTLRPLLKPVLNLTGTLLHTNLGRATLPPEAVDAMVLAAKNACNLELDLSSGKRGERDLHVTRALTEITGAQAATLVNNNAAAVLLALNTLAKGKEVIVSRGELIEIGGSFRLPDIMRRAGCRLVEVGTTNRTHAADYAEAMSKRTAMLLKVHTSNYVIRGFVSEVEIRQLAEISRTANIPLMVDLGSGTLVDLAAHGLPHEPTPQEALAKGANLVAFSGDKVLGGPQAGMILGDAQLIERLVKNPLKRALRLDKIRIAGLEAVLRLYRTPERVAERLPALAALTRPLADLERQAEDILPLVANSLGPAWEVKQISCEAQFGSGALPDQTVPSLALAIKPRIKDRKGHDPLKQLESTLRSLPIPVLGRIWKGHLLLDLRCLSDEATFVSQLGTLHTQLQL